MEIDYGPVCREHLECMQWADSIALSALSEIPEDKLAQDQGSSFNSLFDTLNHIYLAELVWLNRVTDDPNARLADQPVPPDLDSLKQSWRTLHKAWNDWARSRSLEDWARPLIYSNQTGVESRVPFGQVVMHLVNHGSYHRGQLATMLRQAGIKPQGTDLIMFYKSRQ